MKRLPLIMFLVVLLTACGLLSRPNPTPDLKATEDAIRAQLVATMTAEAQALLTKTLPPTNTPVLAPTDTPVPQPVDTPTTTPEATSTDTPTDTPVPAPEPTATPTELPATPTPATYTVQAGDSLSKIAEGFGVAVAALAAYNDIDDPGKVYVGQILQIPPAEYIPPTSTLPRRHRYRPRLSRPSTQGNHR